MSKEIDMVIRALEKQKPKPARKHVTDVAGIGPFELYFCNCGLRLNKYVNYCSNCGQLTDWSDSDE